MRLGRTTVPDGVPGTWVVLGGAVRKLRVLAGALGSAGQWVVEEEVGGGSVGVRVAVG